MNFWSDKKSVSAVLKVSAILLARCLRYIHNPNPEPVEESRTFDLHKRILKCTVTIFSVLFEFVCLAGTQNIL